MRPLHTATLFLLASLFLTGTAAAQKSPEKKLLEAELLEVVSGDLDGAMAVYRALQADETTPEPVRARALLYLARCLRKRGQLQNAEKILAGLVKTHTTDAAVLRQARSFLEELRRGKSWNPAFDWLGAMEKNPEIQARVFQLAMDVAIPDSQAGVLARKQLLSLGRIAVPVLEKLCDASRQPDHRKHLALILVHTGRFEKLAVLFGQGEAPHNGSKMDLYLCEFTSRVNMLDAGEKKRLLAALDAIRPQPAAAAYLAMIRILAGESRDLAGKLKAIETLVPGPFHYYRGDTHGLSNQLHSLVKKDRALEAALAERLRDPILPWTAAEVYLDCLGERVLTHLERKEVVQVLSRQCPRDHAMIDNFHAIAGMLQKEKDVTTFARMAAIPALNKLVHEHFLRTYSVLERPAEVPRAWGPVLRAGAYGKELHQLAEQRDDMVETFTGFLLERKKKAPGYLGYGGRDPAWRPSAAYAAAMKKVLDVHDPVSQAIAAEALALEPKGGQDNVLPALRTLILNPRDLNLREIALYALLKRFEARPASGPAVARILVVDYKNHQEGKHPRGEYHRSPLHRLVDFGCLFIGRDYESRSTTGRFKRPGEEEYADTGPAYGKWVIRDLGKAVLPGLIPHVMKLCSSRAGMNFLTWTGGLISRDRFRASLIQGIPTLSNPRACEALLTLEGIDFLGDAPAGRTFLEQVALDRKVNPDARLKAMSIGWPESTGWFDWPRLFQGEDPLVRMIACDIPRYPSGCLPASAFNQWKNWLWSRPIAEREVLARALSGNPAPEVRDWFLEHVHAFTEDTLPYLRKGLEDPSTRSQSLRRILHSNNDTILPLLLTVIQAPEYTRLRSRNMKEIINKLVEIAAPESLEPLAALLEDPDLRVRSQALRGLKEIREALEEKKKWKQIIKDLKTAGHETK